MSNSDKVSSRRKNRITAIQFLYMWEMNKPEELSEELRIFFEDQDHEREYFQFAEELINGVINKIDELDKIILEKASNWSFNRIAKTDLAILRLATFEILFRKDIPPVVSINEAIDLGKAFSSDESNRFINGILDRLANEQSRSLRD